MAVLANIVSSAPALEIVVTITEDSYNYLGFTKKSILKGSLAVSTNKENTGVYIECGSAHFLFNKDNTTTNGATSLSNDALYNSIVALRDS